MNQRDFIFRATIPPFPQQGLLCSRFFLGKGADNLVFNLLGDIILFSASFD